VLLWRSKGQREVRPAGAATSTTGEADVHGHACHGRGGRRPWQGRWTDMAAAREARCATEGGAVVLSPQGMSPHSPTGIGSEWWI